MGGKGKPKQPAEITLLKGTVNVTREKAGEMVVSYNNLENYPTPSVRLNEYGQREWNGLLAEIIPIKGLLRKVDLKLLDEYCYQRQLIDDMKADIEQNGYFEVTDKGRIISKSVVQLMDSTNILVKLSREFGFSPSSRSGVRIDPQKKGDIFDKYR